MAFIRSSYSTMRVSHAAGLREIEEAFAREMSKLAEMNKYQLLCARFRGRDADSLRYAYEELMDPERRACHDELLDRWLAMNLQI